MLQRPTRRTPRPTSGTHFPGQGGSGGVPPTRTVEITSLDETVTVDPAEPQPLSGDLSFDVSVNTEEFDTRYVPATGGVFSGPVQVPRLDLPGSVSGELQLTASADGSDLLLNGSPVSGFDVDADYTVNGEWTFQGPVTVDPALVLSTQATTGDHAVRADRTITAGAATLGFSIAGGGDLTANRTLTVSPPQDLQVTGAPQFVRLGLGVPAPSLASGLSLAVDGGATFANTVGTPVFTSQTTGWRVNSAGAADFRTIYADELNVRAFTAEVAQALVGVTYLTKSVTKLSREFTPPSTPGATATIYFDDIEGVPEQAWAENGDTVLLRVIDRSGGGLVVANVWGTISGYLNQANQEQSWTWTTRQVGSGAGGKPIYKGAVALDWGVSGDGLVISTVLDDQGSPYTRTMRWYGGGGTHTQYVPTTYAPLTQVGNLASLTTAGFGPLTGYGFWGGRAYFEAGSETMSFDGAFRVNTERLGITGDGTIRVGTASGPNVVVSNSAMTIRHSASDYLTVTSAGVEVYESSSSVASFGSTARIGPTNDVYAYVGGGAFQVRTFGTVYASFGATATVGATTGDHIRVTASAVEVKDASTVRASFGSTTTVGVTTAGHVRIVSSGVEVKTGTTVRASFGSTVVVGQATTGNNNVSVSDSALQFRNGTTVVAEMSGTTFTIGGMVYDGSTTTFAGNVVAADLSASAVVTAGAGMLFRRGVAGTTDIDIYSPSSAAHVIKSNRPSGTLWFGHQLGLDGSATDAIVEHNGFAIGTHARLWRNGSNEGEVVLKSAFGGDTHYCAIQFQWNSGAPRVSFKTRSGSPTAAIIGVYHLDLASL